MRIEKQLEGKRWGKGSGEIWLLWAFGLAEALLLARLVARMLAARPDNPFVVVLYTLSEPLRLPLAGLDANQPLYGAVLELSTLALAALVPLLTLAALVLYRRWVVGGER